MKSRRLLIAALMIPALAYAWPWSQDMMNQPSVKPQEEEPRPYPEHSVPTQPRPFPKHVLPEEKGSGVVTKIPNRESAKKLENPIPPTSQSLGKGRALFRIYCAACHGLTGKADSPVTNKIGAINLTSDYVQEQLTEGWIFGTISFGSVVMPPYGVPNGGVGSNDLSIEERWHVVNYVRHGLTREPLEGTKQAQAE